jgi:excisionase family DNA binding protein
MSSENSVLDAVVQPDPAEGVALAGLHDEISRSLQAKGYRPCLIGPDGSHLELPHSVFQALAFVVRGMAAGQTITLVPSGKQMTTQQAADMLHMSRPHLIKLLDRGAIPFERVGTHRRLSVDDVLHYKDQRAREREEQLDELSRLSQELEGEYR